MKDCIELHYGKCRIRCYLEIDQYSAPYLSAFCFDFWLSGIPLEVIAQPYYRAVQLKHALITVEST